MESKTADILLLLYKCMYVLNVLVFEPSHKCYGRIGKGTEEDGEDVMAPVQGKK